MKNTKPILSLTIVFVLVLVSFACGSSETSVSEPTEEKPTDVVENPTNTTEPDFTPTPEYLDYEIYEDDSYDDPSTNKIIWKVIITSDDINKDSVTDLLNYLYSEAYKLVPEDENRPVVIDITVYPSEEHAKSEAPNDIAALTKNGNDTEPSIRYYEPYFSSLSEQPEDKFGYTEEERIDIFQDIVRAEDQAANEALEKYPNMNPFDKYTELENELKLKYKTELSQETGLTLEELVEIGTEGLMNNWPFPPME